MLEAGQPNPDMSAMDAPIYWAGGAAVFLAAAGGLMTPIDEWYATLRKPAWNPPNWLFGPAWTIIIGLWAWAAVLAWRGASTGSEQTLVLALFGVNAMLHLLWSPLFFKFRRPDLAVIEVMFLWLSLLALLVMLRPISTDATWLLVPYFAWVSFAASLNGTIVRLNRA